MVKEPWSSDGGKPLSWRTMEATGRSEHSTLTNDQDVMRLYLVGQWDHRVALVRVSDGKVLWQGELKEDYIPPPARSFGPHRW
jgi:hypothetical protein